MCLKATEAWYKLPLKVWLHIPELSGLYFSGEAMLCVAGTSIIRVLPLVASRAPFHLPPVLDLLLPLVHIFLFVWCSLPSSLPVSFVLEFFLRYLMILSYLLLFKSEPPRELTWELQASKPRAPWTEPVPWGSPPHHNSEVFLLGWQIPLRMVSQASAWSPQTWLSHFFSIKLLKRLSKT